MSCSASHTQKGAVTLRSVAILRLFPAYEDHALRRLLDAALLLVLLEPHALVVLLGVQSLEHEHRSARVDGAGIVVENLHPAGLGIFNCEVEGLNDKQLSVFGIGPAGENLVRFAAFVGDRGHVAAHNGVGAVLGVKKLKAISVKRGKVRPFIADQKAVNEVVRPLFEDAKEYGGGSLFANSREQWERTFNICWGGVYLCTRAFLPMLVKADTGHIVNTSSINGLWASVGPTVPHTAYSAAKFAVKGFTEALITDLRVNAPHIKCSVVMPGHIGTSIVANSRKVQFGTSPDAMGPEEIAQLRARLSAAGRDMWQVSDAAIQAFDGQAHAGDGAVAGRGDHVLAVGTGAEADQFAEDLGAARLRVLQALEHQGAAAAGDDEAVAIRVVGARGALRRVVVLRGQRAHAVEQHGHAPADLLAADIEAGKRGDGGEGKNPRTAAYERVEQELEGNGEAHHHEDKLGRFENPRLASHPGGMPALIDPIAPQHKNGH